MDETLNPGTMTDAELSALMQPDASPEPEAEPVAPELDLGIAEPAAEEPKAEASKHVPLAELLEERGRRKEAQARIDEMERRFAEFQARAQAALQQQQAAPQQPPPVSYEEDPIEYLRQQQAAVSQNLQALAQQQAMTVQQQQAERHWAAMRDAVNKAEQAFVQSKPDYYDAVNHLKESRRAQLLQQGVPPSHVDQAIAQDAIAVATEAGRLGLSPAEYAYRIAIGSGYTPKQAKAAAAAAAAQEAPRSLGGAAGRTEAQQPTLRDVSKMSDKEFDAFFNKMMVGT